MRGIVNIEILDHGKVQIFVFDGDFYLSNIREVEEKWDTVLNKKPDIIGIDCKKLNFIDSSAIGTLVKFLNNSDLNKIHLIFFDLNDAILRIFETAKLNKIFNILSAEDFRSQYLS